MKGDDTMERLKEKFSGSNKCKVMLIFNVWKEKGSTCRTQVRLPYMNIEEVIEKYGDFQICCKDICQKYNVSANDIHSTYNLYLRDSTMFIAYVEEYNRLQSLYKETLNQMIDNNDLKNEFN